MSSSPSSSPTRIAVIMAGGAGERFWPYSRRLRPKQVLALSSAQPMIAESIARIASVIPAERVLIVAGAHLREAILEAVGPEFPPQNLICEPQARNTAACLALATAVAAQRYGNPTIAVLTADHKINPVPTFAAQVARACEVAEQSRSLITFGIPPLAPDTGFGYIELGPPRPQFGPEVYDVARFREKPDRATAEAFVASGRFFWNSGMFFWTADTIREAFAAYQPAMAAALDAMKAAAATPAFDAVVAEQFRTIESLPIDTAILERAPNRIVLRATFAWDDIGSWTAIPTIHPPDSNGNSIRAEALPLDTRGCILFQTPDVVAQATTAGAPVPLIATLGVENLVIVQTPDAILVCHRDRVQDIKSIVKSLKESRSGRST